MSKPLYLNGEKVVGGVTYLTPDCYSTEERVVGCWTDGRPLYQKSYHISAQIDNNAVVIDSTLDYTVVKIRASKFGSLKIGGNYNNAQYADGRITPESGMRVGLNNTGLWYSCANPPSPTSQNPVSDFDFTILYTKSTDTAGSGSWTPQGVPTHHYSTDEQVVGTWIDGSTLYEKTIEYTVNKSASHTFNFTYGNAKRVVDGFIINSLNSICFPVNCSWEGKTEEFLYDETHFYIKTSANIGDSSTLKIIVQYTKSS